MRKRPSVYSPLPLAKGRDEEEALSPEDVVENKVGAALGVENERLAEAHGLRRVVDLLQQEMWSAQRGQRQDGTPNEELSVYPEEEGQDSRQGRP